MEQQQSSFKEKERTDLREPTRTAALQGDHL